MDKYHQQFQEYQAYLKQQIACRFPSYLSQYVENVANLALKKNSSKWIVRSVHQGLGRRNKYITGVKK